MYSARRGSTIPHGTYTRYLPRPCLPLDSNSVLRHFLLSLCIYLFFCARFFAVRLTRTVNWDGDVISQKRFSGSRWPETFMISRRRRAFRNDSRPFKLSGAENISVYHKCMTQGDESTREIEFKKGNEVNCKKNGKWDDTCARVKTLGSPIASLDD